LGRSDLGPHEERPHEGGPKNQVRDEKLRRHAWDIGAGPARV
jgi:hypothetical protein